MKKFQINHSVELAGVLILVVSMLVIRNVIAATGVMFAVIFISSTLDKVRNKLGKNVFSQNKSANFMRTRVKPSNPKSQAQMTSRGSFTQISRQWKTLTPLTRELWNQYAAVNPITNKLGMPIQISGFNWFMKKNIPLNYMGIEIMVLPFAGNDVKQTYYGNSKAEYDENTGNLTSFTINYKGGSESANVYYEVFMSRQVSTGVTSNRSVTYTYLTKVASNGGGQIEIADALAAKGKAWTNRDPQTAVYFKIRQVNIISGYADAWWSVRHFVN